MMKQMKGSIEPIMNSYRLVKDALENERRIHSMGTPNLSKIDDLISRVVIRMKFNLDCLSNMYQNCIIKTERYDSIIRDLEELNKQREYLSLPYMHYKLKLVKIPTGS
jgi:biotin synthase-like enzyme